MAIIPATLEAEIGGLRFEVSQGKSVRPHTCFFSMTRVVVPMVKMLA
jgi:hypothetical protein